MNNLNQSINNLTEIMADCVMYEKTIKKTVKPVLKDSKKFKVRRYSPKRVHGF